MNKNIGGTMPSTRVTPVPLIPTCPQWIAVTRAREPYERGKIRRNLYCEADLVHLAKKPKYSPDGMYAIHKCRCTEGHKSAVWIPTSGADMANIFPLTSLPFSSPSPNLSHYRGLEGLTR